MVKDSAYEDNRINDAYGDAVVTHQEIYQEPPLDAISKDGQWLRVALIKFGYNVEERVGTRNKTFWLSFEMPYGHETRVALPLVEIPTKPPPDGCITQGQIAESIRNAYWIYLKAQEEKEDSDE